MAEEAFVPDHFPDQFVVETERITAGVAVRVPGGFRFFHSDARFSRFEGQTFRSAQALSRSVRELAQALRRTAEPAGS